MYECGVMVAYEEDVMVSRDVPLTQNSVVCLPTTKHLPHVLTDGDGERLAQSYLRGGAVREGLTIEYKRV